MLNRQRNCVQHGLDLQDDRYCRTSPCQHAPGQSEPALLRGRRLPLPPSLPPSKGERGAAPVSAPLPGGMPPPDPMDLLQRAPVTGSQQMMAALPGMPCSVRHQIQRHDKLCVCTFHPAALPINYAMGDMMTHVCLPLRRCCRAASGSMAMAMAYSHV